MRTQKRNISSIKRRSMSKDILAKVNMLPVKSLLYAISYLLSKMDEKQSAEMTLHTTKAKRSLRQVIAAIESMRSLTPISAQEFSTIIDSAVSSYINLYYSIDDNVRAAIMHDFGHKSSARHESIGSDEHMLLLPLKMFKKRYTKSGVISLTRKGLYKKPLAYLHGAIEASRKVEMMQMRIGLKTQSAHSLSRIAEHIKMLDKRILEIEGGIINPEQDDEIKIRILDELAALAGSHQIQSINYINAKLDEVSFNGSTASRMLRG